MCFGTRYQVSKLSDTRVYYNGTEIELVSSYKYLGVMLDSYLNYTANTEYITKKLVSRIGLLGRTRKFLSQTTCVYLYRLLILPLLDYMDYIYDGTTQRNIMILQKLQNSAARRILRAKHDTPSAEMHQELGWDKLELRRIKHTCEMVYKIINGLAPERLKEHFVLVSEISTRSTRQTDENLLYLPK